MSGVLSVVATPIGNLDDLSPRAIRTLAGADIIACEDTRVARTLLTRVPAERRARLVACHARNEAERVPELVRAVAGGARVVLTTDAGMPGLSDPGQRLIAACADAGLRIEVIPGPSAVTTALVASGLPTARFVFEGFLPRTRSARRKRVAELAVEERTLVIFEAPHRIADTLDDLVAGLGDRRVALARELTKVHEEIVRTTLSDLADRLRDHKPRGEITLVIEGAVRVPRELEQDASSLADLVAERITGGMDKRDAIAAVALDARVSKRVVYQAVLDARE